MRGTEDLGGGLKVGFWLESAVAVDDGTSGATSSNNKDLVSGGLTWGRRATVQLSGDWGELRLGRDYVPSFGNLTTSMHPFGTNGVGSSGLMFYPMPANGTTARMIGTQWQVGPQSEIRFAYTTLSAKNIASDATRIALGYVYDLSKRTALYGNVARIDNKGAGVRFNVGLATTVPGGKSGGVEAGIRHSF